MSESAATAWIIDRLEIENTKMEEEMGNMDTCEGDSVGGKSGMESVTPNNPQKKKRVLAAPEN